MAKDDVWSHHPRDHRPGELDLAKNKSSGASYSPSPRCKQIWAEPSFLDCEVIFHRGEYRRITARLLISILLVTEMTKNIRMHAAAKESHICILCECMLVLESDSHRFYNSGFLASTPN